MIGGLVLIAAHSISAGVTGSFIGNPILAFLVGFVLHLLLDAIPHYDPDHKLIKWTSKKWIFAVTDLIIGACIIFFILNKQKPIDASFIAGMIGGNTPDILDVSPFWAEKFAKSKWGKWFHDFHYKIEIIHTGPLWGLSVQALVIILFSLVYLKQ